MSEQNQFWLQARRHAVRWLSPILLAGMLIGCSEERGSTGGTAEKFAAVAKPHVVVISIDTLRSDRLPAYGYAQGQTPHIDRLANEGVVFERAYTPAPLTLPAHSSLFTGTLPNVHGVRDNTGYTLSGDLPTLAEELSANGYRTAGAVSAWVMRRETGIARGFDSWSDDIAGANAQRGVSGDLTLGEQQRSGDATLRALLDLFPNQPKTNQPKTQTPAFLFLHLFEPHDPYTPPEPYASRFADPYDGEIATVDAVVGELIAELEARGLYDNALIVLLSDHGEGLGDHGEQHHGLLLHREVLQVPLIVKFPAGTNAGRRVHHPVALTDVKPFVLDQAGAHSGDVALARALEGSLEERALYAETFYPRLRFGWSELHSTVLDNHHLIAAPSAETKQQLQLFDLHSDPGETRDLAQNTTTPPAALDALRDAMSRYDVRFQAPRPVSREDQQALAALGYLSGTAQDNSQNALRPHPKDRVHLLDPLREAMTAIRSKDWSGALTRLERVLKESPDSLDAVQMAAVANQRAGQLDQAAALYERAFELAGQRGPAATELAMLEATRGRFESALRWARAARTTDQDHPYMASLEVDVLRRLGRLEEARTSAANNVALFPESYEAVYQLATLEIALGELEQAESHLQQVLEVAPTYLPALSDLAVLLTVEQRYGEAEAVFRTAIEAHPDDPGLAENLQTFLTRTGRLKPNP